MRFGFEPRKASSGRGFNAWNFTEDVRRALARAREESQRLRHEYVGTEHLLLGLLKDGANVAVQILQELGVDRAQVRAGIEGTVKPGKGSPPGPDLPYTSRAKKSLELAMTEARDRNDSYVGAEHLLLGVLREEKGIAAQILVSLGVTRERVAAAMRGDATTSFEIRIDFLLFVFKFDKYS